MSEQERRAHPRFPVWVHGLLTVVAPDRPELIRQRSITLVDLSERGAMVALRTEESLRSILICEARQCRLSFVPSTGLPSEILARAVWTEPARAGEAEMKVGFFFEQCPSGVLAQLRQYLSDPLSP